jgi:Zn-dependent protease
MYNNTQYSYSPPPASGLNDLINRLRWLIEVPYAYITFFVTLILAFYLSLNDIELGPRLFILLLAFPIHELAHALTADYLGDDTPRFYGHITLNPFAQLNLLGSLLMIFIGLGWAYVPISPNHLRPNPRTGHMLVAVAGPIANLLLAIATAVLWHTLNPVIQTVMPSLAHGLGYLAFEFSFINLCLFFLNLIPLAPLDGFFVLRGLLPPPAAAMLEQFQAFSMLIFMGLFLISLFTGGFINPIGWLIFGPAFALTRLIY